MRELEALVGRQRQRHRTRPVAVVDRRRPAIRIRIRERTRPRQQRPLRDSAVAARVDRRPRAHRDVNGRGIHTATSVRDRVLEAVAADEACVRRVGAVAVGLARDLPMSALRERRHAQRVVVRVAVVDEDVHGRRAALPGDERVVDGIRCGVRRGPIAEREDEGVRCSQRRTVRGARLRQRVGTRIDRGDRGESLELVRRCAVEDGEAHALARIHPAESEVEERAVVLGPLVGEVTRVAEVGPTRERIRRREAVVAVEQKFGVFPPWMVTYSLEAVGSMSQSMTRR